MKQIFFIVCTLVTALLVGCATSSDGKVIGRDALNRPAWVNDIATVAETSDKIFVSDKKSGVIRLDLGVRQAQNAAKAKSKQFTIERTIQEIRRLTSSFSAETQALIEQKLSSIPAMFVKVDVPDAIPQAIYSEEIRTETTTGAKITYDIYVLVSLYRSPIDEVIVKFAQQMSVSKNSLEKTYGEKLLKTIQNGDDVENNNSKEITNEK